jgi:hypothetical protein
LLIGTTPEEWTSSKNAQVPGEEAIRSHWRLTKCVRLDENAERLDLYG